MKNLFCILLLVCFTLFASAQKVYFVYFQTEDHSAFYVKLNDKIYSASTAGYLILPNLKDSTYNFSIGFSSSQAESKFVVPVSGKDRGFLIKKFESGLGLFDLQTLSVIRAQKEETDKSISYQKRNDSFAFLLSKAANDTSLLYAVIRQDSPVQKPEQALVKENKTDVPVKEPKTNEVKLVTDTVSTLPQTDLVIEKRNEVSDSVSETKTQTISSSNSGVKNEEKSNAADSLNNIVITPGVENKKVEDISPDSAITVNSVDVYRRSVVKKHAESSTSEGFGLVFYDTYDDGMDTIRLIIPNPKIVFKQPETDSLDKPKEFIQVSELNKDTVAQLPVIVSSKSKTVLKPNCKSIATNNDFFKLRKNMAAKETDEGMVDEAKKYFKTKCFSTEQIKNLSALFLTSAGKYQFFDAAYFHISDRENFPSLESEIKDDYYLKRFKALIGD